MQYKLGERYKCTISKKDCSSNSHNFIHQFRTVLLKLNRSIPHTLVLVCQLITNIDLKSHHRLEPRTRYHIESKS